MLRTTASDDEGWAWGIPPIWAMGIAESVPGKTDGYAQTGLSLGRGEALAWLANRDLIPAEDFAQSPAHGQGLRWYYIGAISVGLEFIIHNGP
jgi:hypothetical protein